MKIRKGDNVRIIAGKDKGKSGKIIKLSPKTGRITLEGLNLYKKHTKPKRQGEKGEMVQVPRPMAISNAMLICGSCKKAVRAGFQISGQKKIRVCKKCGAAV